mmetsp:Transcript_20495/g.46515  ORF Transcript_20495/g.46515 Transcript_20495/m.46515 type:complete len:289 (-) Transcript_20495:172-1038(-)
MLPIYFRDISPHLRSILSIGAAGIFLAASIVHLLPDAVENQKLAALGCAHRKSESGGEDCENIFPWAYLFYGTGFLMILCLETFADSVTEACAQDNLAHEYGSFLEARNILAQKTYDKKESVAESSYRPTVHGHCHRSVKNETGMMACLLFLSLSFHSVMEGVAIGAQQYAAWDICLAVIAHKALADFALGLELISAGLPTRRFVFSIFSFSIMSPVGIFIGWLSVKNDGAVESVASGIFTALSGGTFLFVGVMEIIPKELRSHESKRLKLVVLFASFMAFSILAKWV